MEVKEEDGIVTPRHLPLVDVGVNCANRAFNLAIVDGMLRDAAAAGVVGIVSISNSLRECGANARMAAVRPSMRFTVGIHPHNAKEAHGAADDACATLRAWFERSPAQCVAVGECGLDYNRMFSTREQQLQVFEAQVALAKALGKPLYLHCRDAFEDFVGVLRRGGYTHGVVHCFTGNAEQAAAFASMGLYMGVTGWVFDSRRNADLVGALASGALPLGRLLVETDTPFMPICTGARKSSSPKDVRAVVGRIAELVGVDAAEVARASFENSCALFGAWEGAE